MTQLETPRLILKLGRSKRPTSDEIEAGYKRYVIEHEDPNCPFEVYQDEVVFSYLRAKRDSEFGYYNLILKAGNREIGHCSFTPKLCSPEVVGLFDSPNESWNYSSVEMEIGWAVSKFYRRKGYATEGAKGLIEYGFTKMKVKRVVAFTEADNIASRRVMEKLGMKLVHFADNDERRVGILENSLPLSPVENR